MSNIPSNDSNNDTQSYKNAIDVTVMVIAETQQQRLAFSDTVTSLGMTLVHCISPDEMTNQHLNAKADIWLVDSQYDNSLYQKLNQADEGQQRNKTILVGFNKAPYLNEIQPYEKWQRKLKRKLANILDLPDLLSTSVYSHDTEHWRYVVVLGASMGGPVAVKAFLDHLSAELPITILLAQHFNNNMIDTLPRILNRHNEWGCRVITTSQIMQSGDCLIVPIDQKVVCDSTGRIILTKDSWDGDYKPNIGDLLKNASDAFGDELIGIIFSGMGEDGTQHLSAIQTNDSQLWVQEPQSSTCPSQPQAVIDSGFAQFVGSPKELAEHLSQYVAQALQ